MKAKIGPMLFSVFTLERPWTVVRLHEELLRALPTTLHDFLWVFQADAWTLHEPADITERWLKNGAGVLGAALRAKDAPLFDFARWCAESERTWNDSPMRGTMRETYLKTFPLVFKQMRAISDRVVEGRYFWSREAPEYFRLVETTPIPEEYDWEGIMKFVKTHKIEEPR